MGRYSKPTVGIGWAKRKVFGERGEAQKGNQGDDQKKNKNSQGVYFRPLCVYRCARVRVRVPRNSINSKHPPPFFHLAL